ncbi:unnamed protein product, partial [Phaeothamnion confervicola]
VPFLQLRPLPSCSFLGSFSFVCNASFFPPALLLPPWVSSFLQSHFSQSCMTKHLQALFSLEPELGALQRDDSELPFPPLRHFSFLPLGSCQRSLPKLLLRY